MKNPATHRPSRDVFNCFTESLVTEMRLGRTPLVRLRDGRIVELYWFDEDGPEYEGLASSTAGNYRWNNDGTSITSQDYDIMELICYAHT